MTESEELKAIADRIEMLGLQIFANLTVVVGTDLNRMALLVTQLGSEELVAEQGELEPKLDDFKNAVWEFNEKITNLKGLL